jgi:hypothetical protein
MKTYINHGRAECWARRQAMGLNSQPTPAGAGEPLRDGLVEVAVEGFV